MTLPAKVGMQGFAPSVVIGQANPEAAKYSKLWAMEDYRKVSPGEVVSQLFLNVAKIPPGSHVIDFGCGTGRGALMMAVLGRCKVTMVDFTSNCLDDEIRQACETQPLVFTFVKADLELPLPVTAPYGFCCDVMEHIPPHKVRATLQHILKAAQHVFFSISTREDRCGVLIDEPLHLTVKPFDWWKALFKELAANIYWSQEHEGSAMFYVSAWSSGREIVNSGVLNEEEQRIRDNVAFNIREDHGWMQINQQWAVQPDEFMILGGGPSLGHFVDEIRQRRAEGVKMATLNGAYAWALERDLSPSCQIVMDARPFNARFTRPVVDQCKYLLASQVHPTVLEGLPKDRTWLFHTMPGLVGDLLTARYGPNLWRDIPGGSTVLLRAIPLLRVLGYRKFHLYGCDSCLFVPDVGVTQHHAYAQAENDSPLVIPVSIGDGGVLIGDQVVATPGNKIFYCHPWMVSQAQEFIDMIKAWGDHFELVVHGDGLLAHILETGARGEPPG